MRRLLFILSIVSVALWAGAPAQAQSSKYSTWQNPAETEKAWAKELQTLIDEAEKARAADPVFLRDLRAIITKYDKPALTDLLVERFQDGDFTKNPVWQVTSGKYWIEPNYGLRSVVDPAAAAPQQPQSSGKKQSGEDIARAVLGSVLKQALGQKDSGGQQAAQPSAKPSAAAIKTALKISNAFSMRLELSSWKNQGALELGPTQGAAGGYRLVYKPGAAPGLQLVRMSSRGDAVIGEHKAVLTLEDRRNHIVEWSRSAFGEMSIKVDGKELIKATNLDYRDPFDGFTLVNRGGDYVLANIVISGTR